MKTKEELEEIGKKVINLICDHTEDSNEIEYILRNLTRGLKWSVKEAKRRRSK